MRFRLSRRASSALSPGGTPKRRYVVLLTLGLAAALAAAPGLDVSGGSAAASTKAGPTQPVRSCASLTELTFGDGSRVTSASQTDTAPAICNITLTIPQSNTIVMALPVDTWNGRFQGTGDGGYGGNLPHPALIQAAAQAGYAIAGTNTGHSSSSFYDGSWAWTPTGMNWSLINDFAYRSVREMTVKGKAITTAYYGRAPSYSYWNGCSGAGRQGLMEAQRFPQDYDGILAAAPATNWDRLFPAMMWPQVVMREAGDFVPQCKFDAVNKAVVAACDGKDGVTDGVMNPQLCTFDPRTLIGTQTPCGQITATDAAVVKKIWDGPRRTNGSRLWYGLSPGTPFTFYAAGSGTDGQPNGLPLDWFKYWLAKDPAWDWHTLTSANFATYFDQSRREWNDVLGTDDPDLSAFRDTGGKMIIWHGWADEAIMAQGTPDYYQRVLGTMGGTAKTERFARLFMAPGVQHCIGGAGAAPADPLAALVKWVEQGQAPDTLLAKNGDMTRPLCRWPNVARYDGSGSTNDPANYTCTRA